MRIIVVGAGEVGSYVAEKLSREGHDVALIDQDPARAKEFAGRLDAHVIHGSGTSPQTLAEAGAARADLVVAVTSDDETNVVSAMLAKHAGTGRSIVRIQDRALRDAVSGDLADRTGADMVIDPDEETSAEIQELVEYPGAIEVDVMARGEILVLGFRLSADAPAVGHTLKALGDAYAPDWQFLFGAITRGDQTVIPRGDQRLAADDHVRVVCTPQGRNQLAELVGRQRSAPQRVLLLGGGRTAELLAPRLAR
ncbi:MAG TPA: NAD-binding protein [Acidimicrobiales bacterium]|nr:NAD-binding protein [Acidimicrobiales bacterium]